MFLDDKIRSRHFIHKISCIISLSRFYTEQKHGDSKVKFKQQILLKGLRNSASTQYTLLKCTHAVDIIENWVAFA